MSRMERKYWVCKVMPAAHYDLKFRIWIKLLTHVSCLTLNFVSSESGKRNVSNENSPLRQNYKGWKDLKTSIQNMAQHSILNLEKFSFAFPFFPFLIAQQIQNPKASAVVSLVYFVFTMGFVSFLPLTISFSSSCIVFEDGLHCWAHNYKIWYR